MNGGVRGIESDIEGFFISNSSSGLEWVVHWDGDHEDFGSDARSEAIPYVICVDKWPAGYQQARFNPVDCSNINGCSISTPCQDAQSVLIGGNFDGIEAKLAFLGGRHGRTTAGWYPAVFEFGSDAIGSGSPLAVCAAGIDIEDVVFLDGFDP